MIGLLEIDDTSVWNDRVTADPRTTIPTPPPAPDTKPPPVITGTDETEKVVRRKILTKKIIPVAPVTTDDPPATTIRVESPQITYQPPITRIKIPVDPPAAKTNITSYGLLALLLSHLKKKNKKK